MFDILNEIFLQKGCNMIKNLADHFYSILVFLGNFVIVNMLCLLCCIPVITAGPAICAMYYCMLKIARKEGLSPLKDFFHSFKNNLKQGCLLQLIVTITSLILAEGIYASIQLFSKGSIYQVLTCLFFMAAFVFALIFTML